MPPLSQEEVKEIISNPPEPQDVGDAMLDSEVYKAKLEEEKKAKEQSEKPAEVKPAPEKDEVSTSQVEKPAESVDVPDSNKDEEAPAKDPEKISVTMGEPLEWTEVVPPIESDKKVVETTSL